MTDPDRIYTKGETFLLPVTIHQTDPLDGDGDVMICHPRFPGVPLYVPASALLPADRTYTSPEGFRVIPTEDWVEDQSWWPLGADRDTFRPFFHPPTRADRTHVMVRDTPATERVPWHTAVGRTVPGGGVVKRVGMSGKYPHGAISLSDAPVWHSASDDGTVEVLTTPREVSP